MADRVDEIPADEPLGDLAPEGRRWLKILAGIGLLLGVIVLALWLTRETIADNIIAGQLRKSGLQGTYHIERIGPRRQVLTRIVIGNPGGPDLTIERAEVTIEPRLGFPVIGEVRLVKARLYGSYRRGRLTFGSLDKLLAPKQPRVPFRLPDLDLRLDDARARVDTPGGAVGVKLAGAGNLRDGFSGIVAAIAPRLAMNGCMAERASLYGKLSVANEQPAFDGPLRLAALDCKVQDLALHNVNLGVKGTLDKALDGGEAQMVLDAGIVRRGDSVVLATTGVGRASYRKQALALRYDVTASGVGHPQLGAAGVTLVGMLRAQDGFARIETEGQIKGQGLHPGKGLDAALAGAQRIAKDTPADALLGKLRSGLVRNGPNSKLNGSYVLRQTGGVTSLIVPQATVTGGLGQGLLAVSRLQLDAGGVTAPKLSGNFTTGGRDLPQIAGRLERSGHGMTIVRLAMAEYSAGSSRLSLPELSVSRTADGAIGFSGLARISGPLPGGSVSHAELPLDGRWLPGRNFELWRGCRAIRFAGLTYANLTLERRGLTVCPGAGGAVVRSGPRGLTIAAATRSLDLTGRLGSTPIRLTSGAVSLSNPGRLDARQVQVSLGPLDRPANFVISRIEARMGAEIAGSFSGTEARLFAVPLDITDAAGQWLYAGGKLTLSDASFTLTDRPRPNPEEPGNLMLARFEPLRSEGASLSLANSRIVADAVMRNPKSARQVVDAHIEHDLDSATGFADLIVPGLKFDRELQPTQVTYLAGGVVENAVGVVTGKARVDWNAREVTSTGAFSTESLDFGALFGPVKGLSGTVVFTDLLNMVTAPNQYLRIASINPGIEAIDGELTFELQPESVLVVHGASWPFLDGRMVLMPTTMKLGAAEERRYELKMQGISAARFVEQMELANISATGLFDGQLPLVFDENGGRIEGGLLVSRPPGGNVAYVGDLTYQDLGAMANFAFDALRSLDYRQMRIAMDGALEGELVTRVRFDGVTQGAGAKRNLITRQLGKLPVQFNVNLRAPFYEVINNFKALYDPAYVKDPRSAEVGLLDAQGRPKVLLRTIPSPAQPPIQRPESEKSP